MKIVYAFIIVCIMSSCYGSESYTEKLAKKVADYQATRENKKITTSVRFYKETSRLECNDIVFVKCAENYYKCAVVGKAASPRDKEVTLLIKDPKDTSNNITKKGIIAILLNESTTKIISITVKKTLLAKIEHQSLLVYFEDIKQSLLPSQES